MALREKLILTNTQYLKFSMQKHILADTKNYFS